MVSNNLIMEECVIYYLRGGKPLSEKHRQHLSLAMKGKQKSPEHRAAISEAIKDWWRARKKAEAGTHKSRKQPRN